MLPLIPLLLLLLLLLLCASTTVVAVAVVIVDVIIDGDGNDESGVPANAESTGPGLEGIEGKEKR